MRKKENLQTPILLITFNRPDTTQKVFDKIRQVKPSQLFISADGPRPDNKNDKANCKKVRKIIDQIDWDCKTKTLFHKTNLGCGLAPSTAISWFFNHVNEGIILEDDCVPNLSFFFFCQKMLKLYRDDSRVFHISGTKYPHNFNNYPENSYYFTQIPENFGWATWKRAWEKYDFKIRSFPLFKANKIIKNIFEEELFQQDLTLSFQNKFEKLKASIKPSAWDLQWLYTVLTQNGLCITPTKNLISNIGFGENSTHTKYYDPFLSNLETQEIDVTNIEHPIFMIPEKEIDRWAMKNILKIEAPTSNKIFEIKNRIKTRFPKLTKLYITTKRSFFYAKNKK